MARQTAQTGSYKYIPGVTGPSASPNRNVPTKAPKRNFEMPGARGVWWHWNGQRWVRGRAPKAAVAPTPTAPTTTAPTTTAPSSTRQLTVEEILADPTQMAGVDMRLAPELTDIFSRSGLAYSPAGSGRAATVSEVFQNPDPLNLTVGGRTIRSGVEGWEDVSSIPAGDVSSGITGTVLGNVITGARRAAAAAAARRSAGGISGGVARADVEQQKKAEQAQYSDFLQSFLSDIFKGIGGRRTEGALGILESQADQPVPGTTTTGDGEGAPTGGTGGGAGASWKPETLAANSTGATMPVKERGAYTRIGKPKGTKLPKNPKPGATFKSSGGVFFVYKSKPKPGWYRK